MVRGLFKEKEKTEGARGKIAPFFFLPSPPSTETEEGKEGGGAPGRRRSGARERPGSRGKRRGGRGGPIPLPTLGGGGARRAAHGGGRR